MNMKYTKCEYIKYSLLIESSSLFLYRAVITRDKINIGVSIISILKSIQSSNSNASTVRSISNINEHFHSLKINSQHCSFKDTFYTTFIILNLELFWFRFIDFMWLLSQWSYFVLKYVCNEKAATFEGCVHKRYMKYSLLYRGVNVLTIHPVLSGYW